MGIRAAAGALRPRGSTPARRTRPPGGGKDHLPDPVLPRRLEKNERIQDVLLRVEDGIGDGLAHVDLRRVVAEDLRPESPDRLDGGFRSSVSEDEPGSLGDVLLLPEERLSSTRTS